MAVATDYTNTQYQAPPYMPCSPRARTTYSDMSDWWGSREHVTGPKGQSRAPVGHKTGQWQPVKDCDQSQDTVQSRSAEIFLEPPSGVSLLEVAAACRKSLQQLQQFCRAQIYGDLVTEWATAELDGTRSYGIKNPAALNSEWGKMVTRADLTPRYQGVTSAGPRAPDPMAPPSNTGVYATMHPISKEPELSNTSDSTNGHFQRCYTALQKRSADYEKQRLQLAQNIAYRYPNPGMPRSKQGRVGGSWRHIKEVLGYGGSRVVFVDGLVRLYDEETGDSGRVTSRPVTPLYAPNRHDVASYSRVLQREREQQAYKPWTSANTTATSGQRPGTTTQSGDPDSNQRYRGFYSYN